MYGTDTGVVFFVLTQVLRELSLDRSHRRVFSLNDPPVPSPCAFQRVEYTSFSRAQGHLWRGIQSRPSLYPLFQRLQGKTTGD